MLIEILLVATAIIATILSFIPAHLAARGGQVTPLLIGAGVWAVFTASMFIWLSNASGYDGLLPLFALIGLSAPCAISAALGGLIGWIKRQSAA